MQGSAPEQIYARDLACRRGDRLLFRRLSLAVGSGEAYHITGANGAGKTTLLRTIAGLADPYAGEAGFAGTAALIDDRLGLEADWPLARALAFWFALDRPSDEGAILERLRLADLADVPVRFLSTGQKKRACLARLIGQDAQVWLLDEPLSGLDSATQALVGALVAEHLASGGAALIASHQALDIHGLKTLAIEDYAPPGEAVPAAGPEAAA